MIANSAQVLAPRFALRECDHRLANDRKAHIVAMPPGDLSAVYESHPTLPYCFDQSFSGLRSTVSVRVFGEFKLLPAMQGQRLSRTYRCPAQLLTCLPLCQALQSTLFGFKFPDLELLDFPGHRHRERIHKPNMLRNLEVGNLAFTELADFVLRCTLAGFQPYPGEHNFTEALVGDSDHLHFGHFGMRI